MYVSVVHTISDPQRFWSAADEGAEGLPAGVTLHSAFPNPDGSRAVCLWQGDSVDAVKEVVEGTVGEVSDNDYFEVDAARAQGLPG
jgi:hypothetical protein